MQILLVEDDFAERSLLEGQIRSLGHEVTACADAETALETYQHTFYPLIIVDLGLPGMNGLELCRRISALPQGARSMLLVITGRDEPEDLQAALDAGADDYLTKPVNVEMLQVRLTIIERQFRDRTHHKQAEEKIHQQHEFLEHVLESLTYPFYVVDPNTYTITMANSTARQNGIFQASTCHVLLHHNPTPCSGTAHPCPLQRVKTTRNPAIVEHLHHDQDGNPKYAEIHAYPIFDDDGNVIQIIEYTLDITERKQVEEELQQYRDHLEELVKDRTAELTKVNTHLQQEITERQHIEDNLRVSEQQYRVLAEYAADGIVIFREGKLVFVNNAFCSMLGYTPDQLLQIDPIDLLRDDYKESGRKRIALIEQGDTTDPYWQVPCVTGDGREVWLEAHWSFINWEDKPATLIAVRDITEQKLRELEIEEEREHLQRENINLKTAVKDRYKFGEIIGKSPLMQEIYELIAHTAATDANVVISGETGTGKELIARTIHQLSDRRDHTFVPVNCGAIPENLFESEFFGYRKGAFSGADQDKAGYFDLAHQGTLFLDEIGELSPILQVKLLRAVENGEYIPLGTNTSKTVDVRIVAATNRDLEEQVQQGLMRDDFFFRLNVILITVPPLRERKEDLPLLIDHFLDQYRKGASRPRLPGHVLQRLYHHDWSGNIRELQNVLQRYLTVNRLEFPGSTRSISGVDHGGCANLEIAVANQALQEILEAFEKQVLLKALEQHRWHKVQTAQTLGIGRKTLYRKMKQFGLM